MQSVSVFDMLKIGVGPSSSHTMGPWQAARRFLGELAPDQLASVQRIRVDLYGSLAKTGKGHGTDIAIQLGLAGQEPQTIDVNSISPLIHSIAEQQCLCLAGQRSIPFQPKRDLLFHTDQQLPFHPNGLRFTAELSDGSETSAVFYSVGGGFVVKEGESEENSAPPPPFLIRSGAELLAHCQAESLPISGIVLQNELAWRSQSEIHRQLAALKQTMLECIHRGCLTEGELPGGLHVHRRAAAMARKLFGHPCPTDLGSFLEAIRQQAHDFRRVLDWVSCFALAVNEENAAFGRVVTAPTNGAAGVIPAVLLYFLSFCDQPSEAFIPFLLTAGEIGSLFKQGATISAAQGGCQAEIGVSSAMAAAALTEGLGGSPGQAAAAAEIAMEHHLGMTCDPISGLVQIPCIERNAMGAIKAITAAEIALQRDPSETRVSLDAVIRTMWETAQDMNSKYKETSEGGLALQITVNLSEC